LGDLGVDRVEIWVYNPLWITVPHGGSMVDSMVDSTVDSGWSTVLHGGSYGGKDGPGCIHRGGGRPTVLTVGVGDICVFTHLYQHLVVSNLNCSAYNSVLPAV
jgi:hypothetical protein